MLSAYSADTIAKIIITRSAQDTIVARDHKRFGNNNGAFFSKFLGGLVMTGQLPLLFD